MTTCLKTKLKILAFVIALFLLIIVGLFWYVLRSPAKDVSEQSPYATMLNRKLFTTRATTLAKNLPEFSTREEYYLSEDSTYFDGVKRIAVLPVHTKIIFRKAYEEYNGVSGFTYVVLTGEIKINKEQYKMEYRWNPPNSVFKIKGAD